MEEKNKKNAGNRTRDLSITDQMSVLANQVHLKVQFRHRFDQKCPFTDSLHRLNSRFARTSSVPLEKNISFVHQNETFRQMRLFAAIFQQCAFEEEEESAKKVLVTP